MVDAVRTRINKFSGNRHSVYLRSDLVEDSTFPFSTDEELVVKIDGPKLVIERAEAANNPRSRPSQRIRGDP